MAGKQDVGLRIVENLGYKFGYTKDINAQEFITISWLDFFALLIYIVLSFIVLFTEKFDGYAYWMIVLLNIRSMIGHYKLGKPDRRIIRNSYHLIITTIFGFLAFLLGILFAAYYNSSSCWVKIMFSIYFLLYFLTEIVNLLFDRYGFKINCEFRGGR